MTGRTSRLTMALIDELLPARPPWRVRRKYEPRTPSELGGSIETAFVGRGRDARSEARTQGASIERLRRDGDQVAQRAQAGERLALELPDALARQVELVADRLE